MTCGVIEELPLLGYFGDEREQRISTITMDTYDISKKDSDFYETSWDFKRNPLV